MQNYAVAPETGCWLWLGPLDRYGYGKMEIDGKFVGMHRYFYAAHVGPFPRTLHCLHKCDTPQCVNPAHLFLGTHAENMQDKARKGRARSGASRQVPPAARTPLRSAESVTGSASISPTAAVTAGLPAAVLSSNGDAA